MNLYEFPIAAPLALIAILTAGTLIVRGNGRAPWCWAVAAIGVVTSLAMAYFAYRLPFDYRLFWLCGTDVRAGRDYYAIDPRRQQVILNPPTALPLFELFAALPLRKGAKLWTEFNAIASLALVPMAYRALVSQGGAEAAKLPRATLAVLAAVVALSHASASTLALGQLSILTTLAILAALHAQGASRPILAGVWLAIATVKVATMLPFLLLFGRRRDLPTWATLGGVTLGLCLSTGSLTDLPARLQNNLRNIHLSSAPGMVNDYSYAGPSHGSMIGLDHALYRLGMRDRDWIRTSQLAAMAVLGVVIARVVAHPRYPRDRSCAIVSLYSLIFFYHRVYDAVLLVVPLVACASHARSASSRSRWRLSFGFFLVLIPLFVYPRWLSLLESASPGWGLSGGMIRAIVLPIATWSVLMAIASFLAATPRPAGPRGRVPSNPAADADLHFAIGRPAWNDPDPAPMPTAPRASESLVPLVR